MLLKELLFKELFKRSNYLKGLFDFNVLICQRLSLQYLIWHNYFCIYLVKTIVITMAFKVSPDESMLDDLLTLGCENNGHLAVFDNFCQLEVELLFVRESYIHVLKQQDFTRRSYNRCHLFEIKEGLETLVHR